MRGGKFCLKGDSKGEKAIGYFGNSRGKGGKTGLRVNVAFITGGRRKGEETRDCGATGDVVGKRGGSLDPNATQKEGKNCRFIEVNKGGRRVESFRLLGRKRGRSRRDPKL